MAGVEQTRLGNLVVSAPSLVILAFTSFLLSAYLADLEELIASLPIAFDTDIPGGIEHLRNRALRNSEHFSQLRLGFAMREFAQGHF